MSGQRKALIIANDEYEQEALQNLRAPAADAEALARVLGDPRLATLPCTSCVTSPRMSSRRRSKKCSRKVGPTTYCCCIFPVMG